MTIEPKTAGRFEQHGRVLAFVPDALKPGTIYTVTVSRGITAGPGGKPMADDLRFQFETDKAGAGQPGATLDFSDVLYESGTTSRPIISMWANGDEETAPPKSAQLDIYRLGSLDAAISAYRQLRAFPAWAQWSNEHPVDTGPLTKVAVARCAHSPTARRTPRAPCGRPCPSRCRRAGTSWSTRRRPTRPRPSSR